jgi:glutamyl-tRNA reductase
MPITCVGISHHTAPIDIRERLWFSDDEIRALLPHLRSNGLEESVLFSTCNRTELYTFSHGHRAAEDLKRLLIEAKGAGASVRPGDMFVLTGAKATEHLFRVASGIDSMVIGDVQILHQMKDGFMMARDAGTAHTTMNRLFQTAFHVGKRARRETAISEGAVSVSYAAVELAGKIFDNLGEKTALVIGAGKMANLTAKHIKSKGIGKLLITNRTPEKTEQLASAVGGTPVPFESFHHHLRGVDIVLSSVQSDQFVLTTREIKTIQRLRGNERLFMIDIGVPRNIEPAAGELDNVFLYDIDSLQGLVTENLQKRHAEIPKVEAIVAEELASFEQWSSSLESHPTIAALTKLAEEIRQAEVGRNLNRFEPNDRELVDIVTKRIVNKLLHMPIVNLRNGHDETAAEQRQKISIVRKLFGIDQPRAGKESADGQ